MPRRTVRPSRRRPTTIHVPPLPYGWHQWASFRLQTDARLGNARPPASQPD
jgi:hypothetical protein